MCFLGNHAVSALLNLVKEAKIMSDQGRISVLQSECPTSDVMTLSRQIKEMMETRENEDVTCPFCGDKIAGDNISAKVCHMNKYHPGIPPETFR